MKRTAPEEEPVTAAKGEGEEPLKKKVDLEDSDADKAPTLSNEVIILPNKKKLKKKPKAKSSKRSSGTRDNNNNDEEEEEEEEEEELQVDFDFFNQQPKDRRAIYGLVKNLLCGHELDVDGLTKAIIDADVGSVIKSDGYEDALAVTTILDLEEDAACNDENTEWIKNVLGCLGISKDEAKSMGLIINERIVNMPTFTLAPAIHKSVFGELEKERPVTAKKYKKYLLIAPYCNVVSKTGANDDDDDDDDDDDNEDEEGSTKKTAEETTKNEFARPEEEIYLAQAERKIEIKPAEGHQEPRPTIAGLISEHAVAGIIDAKKIPAILKQIEKVYLTK